jgi:hypothetical protein
LIKKGALHARRTLRTLVNVGGTNKKSKSIGVQRLIEKYSGLRKLHRKEGVSVSTFNHRKARKDRISDFYLLTEQSLTLVFVIIMYIFVVSTTSLQL